MPLEKNGSCWLVERWRQRTAKKKKKVPAQTDATAQDSSANQSTSPRTTTISPVHHDKQYTHEDCTPQPIGEEREPPAAANDHPSDQTNNGTNPDDTINRETKQPSVFTKDFWETAYQSLNQDEQSKLDLIRKQSDERESISVVLDGTVETVKTQYELRKMKNDGSKVRSWTKSILGATLAAQDVISGLVSVDPSGHASTAWAVVSLGLKLASNDIALQDALFEASEFLTGKLARYTVVEKLFRKDKGSIIEMIEECATRLYAAILRFVIEMDRVHKLGAGGRIFASVSALGSSGPVLKALQGDIEKEDKTMKEFLDLDQALNASQKAEEMLATIEKSSVLIQQLNQSFQLSKLPIAKKAIHGVWEAQYEEGCLKDTRTELLQTVVNWVDDCDGEAFFWLNGMAGTGKSTISRTLANYFQHRGILGGTFFFKKGEEDCDSAQKLIPTIVDQLVILFPILKRAIHSAIEKDHHILSASLKTQFQELVLQPLLEIPMSHRQSVVFILDAVDECRDGRDITQLLGLLPKTEAVKSFDLRFFITGRPEQAVRAAFEALGSQHYREERLQEIAQTEQDIFAFLQDKFSNIGKKDWPGDDTIAELAKKSNPLFIVASTICLFVGDKDFDEVERIKIILQDQQHDDTLAAMYQTILDQLIIGKSANESDEILRDFHCIVGSIVLLYDPLSAPSLASLLDLDLGLVDRRLRLLRSVLVIPDKRDANRTIRPLHLSFRDFLTDRSKFDVNPFNIDTTERSRSLAASCLRLMSDERFGLQKNICQLENDDISPSQIDNIDEHISSELKYACVFWIKHLQDGNLPLDEDLIYGFFSKHFLHWLEAMSILGLSDQALGHIANLQKLVSEESHTLLAAFLADALRILQHSGSAIAICPLQVYSSALIFAPHHSIVRNMFEREILSRYAVLPKVEDDWSALLQIDKVPGHSILALDFSTTGYLVVCVRDEMGAIIICDLSKSRNFQPVHLSLAGSQEDWHWRSAISPDGKLMAFSIDRNVYLRTGDTESPVLLLSDADFSGCDAWSLDDLIWKCLVFSGNSKRLAMATPGTVIRLWDMPEDDRCVPASPHIIETGSVIKEFGLMDEGRLLVWRTGNELKMRDIGTDEVDKDHVVSIGSATIDSDAMTHLACSQNRYKVVFGADLQVWDLGHNRLIQRLWRPTSWHPRILKMSPNERWVVGFDRMVTLLWDLHEKDVATRPFQHYLPEECSYATFSPDSCRMVCGLGNRVVQTWNLVTIERDSRWERSRGRVRKDLDASTSIALSSDGQTLAFYTSRSKSTHVWRLGEIVPGSMTPRWSKKTDSNHLALSPDGRSLAIVHHLGEIVVWDTERKTVKCTIQSDGISSRTIVSISSDGRMLAATLCATGGEVSTVWDITGSVGELLRQIEFLQAVEGTFIVYPRVFTAVAFAPSARYLAAACIKHFELYDLITGETVWWPNLNLSSTRKIGFSLDETRILTERGSFAISRHGLEVDSFLMSEKEVHPHLSVRDGWIISGSRRHLWLPPNYQGEWDSDETSIVVATNQGRVLRFLLRGTDENPALGDNDRGHQRICYQEFNFPLEEPEENGEECQNQKYA